MPCWFTDSTEAVVKTRDVDQPERATHEGPMVAARAWCTRQRAFELYIDGAWQPARSGATYVTTEPSNGKNLAALARGNEDDVGLAVSAARRAFEGPWSRWTPAERSRALLRLAELVDDHIDELRAIDAIDVGRPIGRGSAIREGDFLRYFAGLAQRIEGRSIPPVSSLHSFAYTLREPVGVVGAIIPWNGPLGSAIWKIGPALASGCCLVLKPAEIACLSVLRLFELVERLDLPPGVANLVTGFGPEAGAALAGHTDIDKISFTGSPETGRSILRAATGSLARCTLELGGKSANIVFADAKFDDIGRSLANAAFANSGQICAIGSRLFVERRAHEEVLHCLSEFSNSILVGDSCNPATEMGPLASRAHLANVTNRIHEGIASGARVVAGGARPDTAPADGYFLSPTIFADVSDNMAIAREEIFGPVVSVFVFDEIDEVVSRANSLPYGLAGGVWTQDIRKAHAVAHRLRTGTVWVNSYLRFDPAVPFGGFKMSGWGRELGSDALDEYTEVKSVWMPL